MVKLSLPKLMRSTKRRRTKRTTYANRAARALVTSIRPSGHFTLPDTMTVRLKGFTMQSIGLVSANGKATEFHCPLYPFSLVDGGAGFRDFQEGYLSLMRLYGRSIPISCNMSVTVSSMGWYGAASPNLDLPVNQTAGSADVSLGLSTRENWQEGSLTTTIVKSLPHARSTKLSNPSGGANVRTLSLSVDIEKFIGSPLSQSLHHYRSGDDVLGPDPTSARILSMPEFCFLIQNTDLAIPSTAVAKYTVDYNISTVWTFTELRPKDTAVSNVSANLPLQYGFI